MKTENTENLADAGNESDELFAKVDELIWKAVELLANWGELFRDADELIANVDEFRRKADELCQEARWIKGRLLGLVFLER